MRSDGAREVSHMENPEFLARAGVDLENPDAFSSMDRDERWGGAARAGRDGLANTLCAPLGGPAEFSSLPRRRPYRHVLLVRARIRALENKKDERSKTHPSIM